MGSKAEGHSPSSSDHGEMQKLEIEACENPQPNQQNGHSHVAIAVGSDTNGHDEELKYTRKELKAEEKAGLLKDQTSSSFPGGGSGAGVGQRVRFCTALRQRLWAHALY